MCWYTFDFPFQIIATAILFLYYYGYYCIITHNINISILNKTRRYYPFLPIRLFDTRSRIGPEGRQVFVIIRDVISDTIP